MASYKAVVRYRRARFGPFSRHPYERAWFPTNGVPGPWLPPIAVVQRCVSGWHFFQDRDAVRGDIHATGCWVAHWDLAEGTQRPRRGRVEWWQVHYRQATHWDNKSAARTIRFVRKLSTDEVRALLGDS